MAIIEVEISVTTEVNLVVNYSKVVGFNVTVEERVVDTSSTDLYVSIVISYLDKGEIL